MNAIEMKASVLLAHATPRSLNMAAANSLGTVSTRSGQQGHMPGLNSRKACSKSRSEQIVTGEHTSCVFRVGIREIVQNRVEKEERADGEPCRADDRSARQSQSCIPKVVESRIENKDLHDPMNGSSGTTPSLARKILLAALRETHLHPNQKRQIGMQNPPTKHGGSRFSGVKLPSASNFGSRTKYK